MNKDFTLLEQYAWLLYENRERILDDALLAFTPVCIRSGAAPASFPYPSIAAYIMFWGTEKGMIVRDGRRGLLVRVAGFGGSGCNTCSVAWEDGTSGTVCITPFIDTWSLFLDIIRQYRPDRDCGTLEELITKLGLKHGESEQNR